MGYDIYFKSDEMDITLEVFQNSFEERPHYTVEGDRALYDNKDTGVYFVCEYLAVKSAFEHKGKIKPDYCFRLSMNFCRPSIFITEALHEIDELVNDVGLNFFDPQVGGVGAGPFDLDKMYDNWLELNEKAIIDFARSLNDSDPQIPLVPYDHMKALWEWNYTRETRDIAFKVEGVTVNIPRLLITVYDQQAEVAVIWDFVQPIALPKVNLILFPIVKEEETTGYSVVFFEEVVDFLEEHKLQKSNAGYVMSYKTVPANVQNFIDGLKVGDDIEICEMGDVMEQEIVEAALFPNGRSDAS